MSLEHLLFIMYHMHILNIIKAQFTTATLVNYLHLKKKLGSYKNVQTI